MRSAKERFNNAIEEEIAPFLKKNNFKKKGLSFYKNLGDIGHVINIQKDKWNSQDKIKFTINVGIFSKFYWLAEYNCDHKVSLPLFPHESVSIIRQRIGDIKYGYDYWYKLESQIIERKVISECIADFDKYILPYFNSFLTQEDLIKHLESNLENSTLDYRLFILFCEIGNKNKASILYQKLILKAEKNIKDWLIEKGKKYNIT
ncbi:MAG: DUF4304 domain-containing protein [Saprospiraceae bacterium]